MPVDQPFQIHENHNLHFQQPWPAVPEGGTTPEKHKYRVSKKKKKQHRSLSLIFQHRTLLWD